MPLVDSLLTAIVRTDGDALVLHVGEKPYVVAASGSIELSRQGLGLGAMEGLLAQLLSADALRSLREMGAVEHEVGPSPAAGIDRFTVVAARGGDDIWIEVRRHRRKRAAGTSSPVAILDTSNAPAEVAELTHDPAPRYGTADAAEVPAPVEAPIEIEPVPAVEASDPAPTPVEDPVPAIEETPAAVAAPEAGTSIEVEPAAPEMAAADDPVVEVAVTETPAAEPAPVAVATEAVASMPEVFVDETVFIEMPAALPSVALVDDDVLHVDTVPAIDFSEIAPEFSEIAPEPVPAEMAAEARAQMEDAVSIAETAGAGVANPEPSPEVGVGSESQSAPATTPVAVTSPTDAPAPAAEAVATEPLAVPHSEAPASADSFRAPMPQVEPMESESPVFESAEPQPTLPGMPAASDTLPGVVLSLTRDGARGNGPASRGAGRAGGIERLLRLAAARGASALYLTTQARPAVRVDGDVRLLEGESVLSGGDVEAVLELASDEARDKESAEWIRDLDDVGRVRITTFRDHRGPGAVLRLISTRATTVEQLGLVREIQALGSEPDGLVLVTGPRASGKSTLVAAFVDLINRQRSDYVITLEGQIGLVHERRGSLISQRELRGGDEVTAAARAALRENPDVLVIEDLRSPDALQVALDAAGSGRLVFVSVTAASATAALERLIDLCPSEQRRNVRAMLAAYLRGVVAQVLLHKSGGGRLAARELVLNTSAVAALVSDGQIAQLPRAIDSGRKLGMAPLNDALVAFVQSGAVDVREAYRKAGDKAGLLALLRREGIDTSFVERLA